MAPRILYRWPKRVLFAFLFALFVLPALQAEFHFVEMPVMGGYFTVIPRPDFSPEVVVNGSFQPALEKYLQGQIGFREWMIQFRNQLAYTLFKSSRVNNTVIGRDNIVFDGTAADGYLGKDFVGEEEVDRNVRRFKDVQDTLASHGTLLVFAIAPGKADIYSEMLPAYYRHHPHSRSNYAAYAEKLVAAGVNVFDLAALFRQWKDTSAYPLFPRGGIHWSLLGRDLAVDTLFGYVRQRGHFNFPDCRIISRELSNKPRDSDTDIANAMNLARQPETFLMAYPKLKFADLKPGQTKPNLLVVGDSFAWGLTPYITMAFSPESQLWYYNTEVQWAGTGVLPAEKQVGQLDKRAQLKGRNVVLVLYTEHNLKTFDFNFSSTLYKVFHPYTADDNTKIRAIRQQIMADTAIDNRIWKWSYSAGIDANTLFDWEAAAAFDKIR